MRIQNREELDQIRDMAAAKVSSTKCRILICAGTGCLAGGSGEIYEKMCELTKDCKDVDVEFAALFPRPQSAVSVIVDASSSRRSKSSRVPFPATIRSKISSIRFVP